MNDASRMPALFVGHGNPMNALRDNDWTRSWAGIGRALPKPSAVLCVSAHWYLPGTRVTAMSSPRTIHDFGGFPDELYQIEYPAPGSPELAGEIRKLAGDRVNLDDEWGLDHGTWSVLKHLYPDADVPVVQLSIDKELSPAGHVRLASSLKPLRDTGVLIVGSGNVVHNLHTYAWGKPADPLPWAERFDRRVRELSSAHDFETLTHYESLGEDADLSIPTPEHYLPLLYVLGVSDRGDAISFPVEGIDGGSVSMLAIQTG